MRHYIPEGVHGGVPDDESAGGVHAEGVEIEALRLYSGLAKPRIRLKFLSVRLTIRAMDFKC
jgi:hypothetical protein